MNARKMMVSTLAISLIAGSSALAYAGQKGDCNADKRIDKRLEHMTSTLGLDQTQQTAVMEVLTKQAELRPAHKQGHQRMALAALDPNAPDYQQQVQALIGKMQEDLGQRGQTRADQKAELYAILTPEQEQKLADMRDKRKHHRHEGSRHKDHAGPRHEGQRHGGPDNEGPRQPDQ